MKHSDRGRDEPILPSHADYGWCEWTFLVLSALANLMGILVTTIVDLLRGSVPEPSGTVEHA